jgi:alpha-beta hydrolase superfamily lysophospholipase
MPPRSALLTGDGRSLARQSWLPAGVARASVVVVHGFGEHSGRYTALTEALPTHGIAVYGFDLRGHGRSPGRRGHITRWSDYRDDLGAMVDAVIAEAGGVPVFVFGHSMGGLIVLEWLVAEAAGGRSRVAGAILSAPALEPLEVGRRWQVWASRVLSRAWPTFSMNVPLGSVSGDPAVVAALRDDRLNHRRASARWATEALAAIRRAQEGAATISLPLLVVHGGKDRLIDIAGSRWLIERVASADRELAVYPEAQHEVHNDRPREELVRDLVAWLERHL